MASLVALAALACATSPVVVASGSDTYTHRRLGYEIGRPDVGPGRWSRFTHRGADLAFRQPLPEGGTASMILMSECGRPQAGAGTLARQLLIGLGERTRVASGAVDLHGQTGWSQTFETVEEGQRIRVKSVTLISGKCTFDWVLVARGDFGETEAEFDHWWPTFVHAPVQHAGASGERTP